MPNGKKIAFGLGISLALVYIYFIVIFLIGEGAPDIIAGEKTFPWPFLLFFFCGATGFFVSFRKKVPGLLLMFLSGAAIGIYLLLLSDFRDLKAACILALPFVISAFLIFRGKNFLQIGKSHAN